MVSQKIFLRAPRVVCVCASSLPIKDRRDASVANFLLEHERADGSGALCRLFHAVPSRLQGRDFTDCHGSVP